MIDLILKKKIGKEKTKNLIEILQGGNKEMLAVLEMIEEDNKRILKRGIKQGKEEGKKEGKKEGKIEGRVEEKIEIIKKMLNEKIPIDIICKVTGMEKEEIEKIKSQSK